MKIIAAAGLVGTAFAGCDVKTEYCYVDQAARLLPTSVFMGAALNTEYCAQLCSDKGFALAGAENGNECYCGPALPADAVKAPSSECNVACTANTKEQCGGTWRISVFNVSCSGTPVPRPKAPPKMVNPCLDASAGFSGLPFCNASLPLDERIADALGRMTTGEKISNLGSDAGAIPSLGLNPYNWWSEATHGISHTTFSDAVPAVTNFAFPITTAMSFNRSLWRATGAAIGIEGRAMGNAGGAWATFWAPVINLAREPRWVRACMGVLARGCLHGGAW
jgi:hypothetical protein